MCVLVVCHWSHHHLFRRLRDNPGPREADWCFGRLGKVLPDEEWRDPCGTNSVRGRKEPPARAREEDKAYIKELEKRVGSIRTITKTKLQVQVDTLVMATTDTIIQGDTVRVFSYNDQWLSLNGSVGREVVLNGISLPARLILTEGKNGVGVSVDNPYIKISDIRSVTRPEKGGVLE